MEAIERLAPEAAINEVVPFGNEIIDRAARSHAVKQRAGMAKGHPAVHAASALLLELLFIAMLMELMPIPNARARRPSHRQLAAKLHKSGWFAHGWLFNDPG